MNNEKLIIAVSKVKVKLFWGILSILFSLGIWIVMHSSSWSSKEYTSVITSPVFFPTIAQMGILLSGLLLTIQSVYRMLNKKDAEELCEINLFGVFLALIWFGFALIMPVLGFIVSAVLCLLASFWLSAANMKKAPVYIISVVTPLLFYFLFGKLLMVRFPEFILF